jgi:hypothetical protein
MKKKVFDFPNVTTIFFRNVYSLVVAPSETACFMNDFAVVLRKTTKSNGAKKNTIKILPGTMKRRTVHFCS